MKFRLAAIFMLLTGTVGSAYSEEQKAQGVDLVTDAAAAVVTKAFAILSGNLEVTMTTDTDRIKNKKNYTENAIGQMVPKATNLKKGLI